MKKKIYKSNVKSGIHFISPQDMTQFIMYSLCDTGGRESGEGAVQERVSCRRGESIALLSFAYSFGRLMVTSFRLEMLLGNYSKE